MRCNLIWLIAKEGLLFAVKIKLKANDSSCPEFFPPRSMKLRNFRMESSLLLHSNISGMTKRTAM